MAVSRYTLDSMTRRKTLLAKRATQVAQRSQALLGALILLGCGAGAAPSDSASAGPVDPTKSHFVIEGNEKAANHPRVSVHVDPGDGSTLFSDGVPRYEIRMLPKPLEKDTLTVWVANLRTDMEPGRHEITDAIATPSVLVGVGRGLLKGYHEVLSGHLILEELGERLSFTFEAELESQSMLDRDRQGQRVTVRGRVAGAERPP